MINTELYHYGVLGMKWGVRRYQNSDGTLTEVGKRHQKKVRKKASSAYEKGQKRLAKKLEKLSGKTDPKSNYKRQIIEAKQKKADRIYTLQKKEIKQYLTYFERNFSNTGWLGRFTLPKAGSLIGKGAAIATNMDAFMDRVYISDQYLQDKSIAKEEYRNQKELNKDTRGALK